MPEIKLNPAATGELARFKAVAGESADQRLDFRLPANDFEAAYALQSAGMISFDVDADALGMMRLTNKGVDAVTALEEHPEYANNPDAAFEKLLALRDPVQLSADEDPTKEIMNLGEREYTSYGSRKERFGIEQGEYFDHITTSIATPAGYAPSNFQSRVVEMQAISNVVGGCYFEASTEARHTKGYQIDFRNGRTDTASLLICPETRAQANSMYRSGEIAASDWNYDAEDMSAYLLESAQREGIEIYRIR